MERSYTNGALIDILTKLEAATAKDITLPPKTSYKIVKNKIAIKQALKPYELSRDEIVINLSGGKSVVNYADDPRLFNEINEAIKEIASECVAVDVATISIDDIPDEGVPISFINALDFMIEGC